jgi:hypothetical protein
VNTLKESVELPIDGDIAKAIDELVGPMGPQVDHLMRLLKQGDYLNNGPGSAILIGFALFTYKYNVHRQNQADIDPSLRLAFADAINNELVQTHLVNATTFSINEVAGVPNE